MKINISTLVKTHFSLNDLCLKYMNLLRFQRKICIGQFTECCSEPGSFPKLYISEALTDSDAHLQKEAFCLHFVSLSKLRFANVPEILLSLLDSYNLGKT